MKNVLVLGAGLVSSPLVHYLLNKKYHVTVATRTVAKATKLIAGAANGTAVQLNVEDDQHLVNLIKENDLSISLLPYTFHVKVAEICIENNKPIVTTSYVSDKMKALNEAAQKAGILILNEIGVDPGIDHMSAMKIIDEVTAKGGNIISFKSFCGGLPAPESNTNPFGYKFSWSPKGVVMAGSNNGQYLEDGQVVFIPGKNLFKHYEIIDIEAAGSFEVYTNRDALPYKSLYQLKNADTVFRGTLRNTGWCYTMKKAAELGLFDQSLRNDLSGLTFRQMIARLTGFKDDPDLERNVSDYLHVETYSEVMKKFIWLGLFSDATLPHGDTIIDNFSALLLEKLSMTDDDLDLLVLHHRFIAEYADKKEIIHSTLVEKGILHGDSAMSRTVSLPAAIAADLILSGKIALKGVRIPVYPEIYIPVLKELEILGISFTEEIFTHR